MTDLMYRIGVEIGGTKLQAGLGKPDGGVEKLDRENADSEGGHQAILDQIASLVDRVRGRADVERIGIGFGGPVNVESGSVIVSHQVAGWSGFPLRRWAEERFDLPCVIENDSNCAGLAEACLGAGKGSRSVFYMNVGSGIGGAFVVDGELYTTDVGASEIGHTYVWNPSQEKYVVLESVCSGWAIEQRARQIVRNDRSSRMLPLAGGDPERIDGRIVGRALVEGDPAATDLMHQVADTLAVGLANTIALLNPQRIVIGGGISLIGEPFLRILREALPRRVFLPYRGRQEVVAAGLGEGVVVAGALLL